MTGSNLHLVKTVGAEWDYVYWLVYLALLAWIMHAVWKFFLRDSKYGQRLLAWLGRSRSQEANVTPADENTNP